MASLFSRFGAPNIEKLEAKGDIAGLVKALDYQKDPEIRKAAAQALGRAGDSRVTAALCNVLVDEERDVSNAALAALEKLGDFSALAPILQMLAGLEKYPSATVGTMAAIFARIQDQAQQAQAIDTFVQALDVKEGYSRIAAVEVLAKILQTKQGVVYNEQIMRAVIPLLDRGDDWLQAKALVALKNGAGDLAAADLHIPLAQAVSQQRILKVAGVRASALQILAQVIVRIDDTEMRDSARLAFKCHLDDNYEDVRLVCLQGLAQTGSVDDLSDIARQFSRDVRAPVQKAAAFAMGKIDPDKAVETLLKLIEAFDKQKESTAYYKTNWFGAAGALGELGQAWVVEPLITILQDDDFVGSPSMEAASALGKIGDKRAVGPLVEALASDDKYIKGEAGKALRSLTGQDFGEDAAAWRAWWETSKS